MSVKYVYVCPYCGHRNEREWKCWRVICDKYKKWFVVDEEVELG